MAINEKMIYEFYDDPERENNRSTISRARSIEFYYTKKLLDKYLTNELTVLEIGCGTGYYGIYLHDKCKKYIGIDIVPKNIENFDKKITELKIENIKTFVGDALNISNISNNTIDLVLNLGPMYHLTHQEREVTLLESKRVCKNNGVIICSYINKFGAYFQGILREPEKYPNKKANELILEKGTDDIRPNVFYYTTPEEMENLALTNGLKIIENCGINFLFNMGHINSMDEEKYKNWIEFSDYLFKSRSCTGLSVHGLMVCKKNKKQRNLRITGL
jgi:ubiquinone/menaquinone biosynthesis C-methylase UbiE